jgi:uncharacterized protein
MDVSAYTQSYLARDAARREARKRLSEEVRARLPRAVDILNRELGVTRVILFGSLRDNALRPTSDVDLAVDGLEPERYFEAVDRVARVLRMPVDLVPLEEAPASLRSLILSDGEVLCG